MKWIQAKLSHPLTTGYDELNNPITIDEVLYITQMRFTPFDRADYELSERKIYSSSRKAIVNLPIRKVKECDKVLTDDGVYSITQVTDLTKFTLMYLEEQT